MATRSRTTFQKRQKELARAEKRQEKAARRLQRKREGIESPGSENTPADDVADVADPVATPSSPAAE